MTVQPTPTLDAELLNGFCKSAVETLAAFGQENTAMKGATGLNEPMLNEGVNGLIDFSYKDTNGVMALMFPAPSATALAALLLKKSPETVSNQESTDVISELSNIIAGNAQTHMQKTLVGVASISTPKCDMGPSVLVNGFRQRHWFIKLDFDTACGPFWLQIGL